LLNFDKYGFDAKKCVENHFLEVKQCSLSSESWGGTENDTNEEKALAFSDDRLFTVVAVWKGQSDLQYMVYGQHKGRDITDLENDFFILLKNHFLYQKSLFPSVLAGFENSPNIRQLNTRYYAGAGFGSYIIRNKNNLLQLMVYGLYEKSEFQLLQYEVFRLMPFIKGNHFSEKNKIGIAYTINPYLSPWVNNNWRFRGNIRPYVKIAPKLDFSISYDLWYESLVGGNQPKEISVLMFGFNYSNF
jgi:hypothetical protein